MSTKTTQSAAILREAATTTSYSNLVRQLNAAADIMEQPMENCTEAVQTWVMSLFSLPCVQRVMEK